MLDNENVIPNPVDLQPNTEPELIDDDDCNQSEMKLQEKLILKISHQMEEHQKQTLQFYKYQNQQSEKLFKKIGEFVDYTKLLVQYKANTLVEETAYLINYTKSKTSNPLNKRKDESNEDTNQSSFNDLNNDQPTLFSSTILSEANTSIDLNNESNINKENDSSQ